MNVTLVEHWAAGSKQKCRSTFLQILAAFYIEIQNHNTTMCCSDSRIENAKKYFVGWENRFACFLFSCICVTCVPKHWFQTFFSFAPNWNQCCPKVGEIIGWDLWPRRVSTAGSIQTMTNKRDRCLIRMNGVISMMSSRWRHPPPWISRFQISRFHGARYFVESHLQQVEVLW